MVTKYSGYIHTPATRATGYVEDPNGSVVLASDYDALDEALNECIKDRDWFSDRLDAATAELARVKAESLRVVADGEKCWLDDAGSEAAIYYDPVTDSNYILILTGSGTFLLTGEKIELGKDATVTPVRLERWEATDDHH